MSNFFRKSWFVPNDVSVIDNGRLSLSLLIEVGVDCYLHHSVVESWERMKNDAKKDGINLEFLNRDSCYRDIKKQEDLKKKYSKNLRLRVPGGCSHGFGVAVVLKDCKRNSVVSDWMDFNSIKYGWSRESRFDYSRYVFVGNKESFPRVDYSYSDLKSLFGAKWLRKPNQEIKFKGLSCSIDDSINNCLIPLKSRKIKFSPGVSIKKLKKNNINEKICFLTDRRIEQIPYDNPVLQVKDIVSTVEYFVKETVDKFQGKIITVTGSSGKSSTTNLMSKVLRSYGPCASSIFSNLIDGVYPAALSLEDEDFGVFEVAQGALPRAAQALDADVSVLVSIAPAHMERHASLEDLVRCKSSIFLRRKKLGFAIINHDIPYYEIAKNIAIENGRTVISYGKSKNSDFRLIEYGNGCFRFSALGSEFKADVCEAGEHAALNGLAVIAALHALRINWILALGYLGIVSKPLNGRGNTISLNLPDGECLLVNHAYNANPVSMRSALSIFPHLSVNRIARKIAVLTDMLELGRESKKMHEDIADSLVEFGVDLVLVVSGEISCIKNKMPVGFPCIEFSSLDLLFSYIDVILKGGDIVVFKGSNGTGLNKAVSAFFRSKTS